MRRIALAVFCLAMMSSVFSFSTLVVSVFREGLASAFGSGLPFLLAVQWPLWAGVLAVRRWAWWLLVLDSAVLFVFCTVRSIPTWEHSIWWLPLLVVLVTVVIPLWALLVNRPSTWGESKGLGRTSSVVLSVMLLGVFVISLCVGGIFPPGD